jgi:hypothetical protein
MTNDCWNIYTVIGNPDDINSLCEEGVQALQSPDTGGDRFRIILRNDNGIRFVYKSRWNPNTTWMEQMLYQYPSLWMKNAWREEGGRAGVVVGGYLYGRQYPVQEFFWDDVTLEDTLHPSRRES